MSTSTLFWHKTTLNVLANGFKIGACYTGNEEKYTSASKYCESKFSMWDYCLPPVSPRQERKYFEPQPPRTPIKETASQIYHKSFSDLNKGLDFIFQSKSRPPSRASNFGDVATKEMQHKKETDPGVNGPSNVQSHA